MKRRRRTRILVLGSPVLRHNLAAEIIKNHEVIVLQEPRAGLLMTTMRETARRTLFHLGEVLISESRVLIQGTIGAGIIAGTDEIASYELAVIDAALSAGLPETKGWDALLEQEDMALNERLSREQAELSLTKVSFETMDSEGRS